MSFYTVINCMDGRTQEPVISFIKEEYNVLFVDMITQIAPVKTMSGPNENNMGSIITCIDISLEKHKSKGIAIAAHHDCAGNRLSDKEQKNSLKKAVALLAKKYVHISVCGLWVNKNWKVEKI